MCKSLTNYFPRNNDFLVTYFGKTQNIIPFKIMSDNNTLRTNILTALDEWTRLDAATREDSFIDVDLTDGSVKFIDADELIKYDLEDPSQRLSFFTINPWDIADYNESTQSFSFRQDEVEEAINNAISLQAEFSEA